MKHVDDNICKKKLTLKIVCAGEGLCEKKREEAEEERGSRRREAEEERGSCGDQLFRRNFICPAEAVWVDTWMKHIRSHFLGGLCETFLRRTTNEEMVKGL